MTTPNQWKFLLETFPELENIMASEVMSGLNPTGDKKLADAIVADLHSGRAFGIKPRIVAAEDVVDPCQSPDPFDGCLADDVPAVRFAVRNDAEIDRVARLNRAAPDLLAACEKLVANFPGDWNALDVARAAIAKAAQ